MHLGVERFPAVVYNQNKMSGNQQPPSDPPDFGWDLEDEQGVATETEKKLEKPRLFRVILHNDNYTTMEFVVTVLMSIFHHSEGEAARIMMEVHQKGVGVAGTYSYEVAETRAEKTMQLARKHEYPLRCSVEPVG
jgi:ATP-dependent Clp protease adaptor protein ClpS